MALYFEQLVLIWFCKHLNCTLYGKHLCEILNISTQQQAISYLNVLHSFVAFHGTFWHSTQIYSETLAFQYVYVLQNVTNYSTGQLSTNYTNIFHALNSINDCTLPLSDTNSVWNLSAADFMKLKISYSLSS